MKCFVCLLMESSDLRSKLGDLYEELTEGMGNSLHSKVLGRLVEEGWVQDKIYKKSLANEEKYKEIIFISKETHRGLGPYWLYQIMNLHTYADKDVIEIPCSVEILPLYDSIIMKTKIGKDIARFMLKEEKKIIDAHIEASNWDKE